MVFFLPPPHYTPPPSGEHRCSPPPLFPSSAGESASLAFNVEDEREGAQGSASARVHHGTALVHGELHRRTQLAEDHHGPAPVLAGDATPTTMDARSPGLTDEQVGGGY
jgi:hypothetical protein